MTTGAEALLAWAAASRAEADQWKAANPAGSSERPIVVAAVRRRCLVRTTDGEYGVIEHGGWTEVVGEPINMFTAANGVDWYPTEAAARGVFEDDQ